MAIVIETTAGDITVDLFTEYRPRTCLNFMKLCKLKYYNFSLFHSIQAGFIAQTGDPTGAGDGGSSLWGLLHGPDKRYFQAEKLPAIKHTVPGLLSMVATEGDDQMVGSQFFFTLGPDLNSLDGKHCVIGEVTEGHDVLRTLNETICDSGHRPYQDVRITHTVILEDPYDDPEGFSAPDRSPSPSAERLAGGRIAPDEEIDEFAGKTEDEITEMIEEREAKARATILEIVGDLPDADMAPPENVLFVCKLNPVTTDDDLEIIFSRFGKIKNCEVIRDRKSGDSLQYAFIEFEEKKSCEDAYFKMDNVLIDDRRIHVDFSQSVSKIRWKGKGRGVVHYDDEGSVITDEKNIKTENQFDNVRNRGRNEKLMRRNDDYRNNSDRYRRPSREREASTKYKERSPNRNYIHSRDNKNRREDGRYQYRSPDRKRPRSLEKYRQKSDHRRRSPPRDSDRRYYERSRDDRNGKKDNSKHRSRTPERRKSPERVSNSRRDKYDVSNGKSHNREVHHSKNRNYPEQYNKRNDTEQKTQSNNRKHLKRKPAESSEDEPSNKKKKNSADKKRKNSSTSSDESSDEVRKKQKKNVKSKTKNREKSSSSEDVSTSFKKKTSKNNKKDNKTKKSKNVPSSSNSSSSSSSSTDSEDSSTTSNSSDSGHERSRKKSKNKKSVREKLVKKKSKK